MGAGTPEEGSGGGRPRRADASQERPPANGHFLKYPLHQPSSNKNIVRSTPLAKRFRVLYYNVNINTNIILQISCQKYII